MRRVAINQSDGVPGTGEIAQDHDSEWPVEGSYDVICSEQDRPITDD
jgi:hypothetical protein